MVVASPVLFCHFLRLAPADVHAGVSVIIRTTRLASKYDTSLRGRLRCALLCPALAAACSYGAAHMPGWILSTFPLVLVQQGRLALHLRRCNIVSKVHSSRDADGPSR